MRNLEKGLSHQEENDMARGMVKIKIVLPGGYMVLGKFRPRDVEKILQNLDSGPAAKIKYEKQSFWSRLKFWQKSR